MKENIKASNTDSFDHSTHQEFVEYYANESLSDSTINRMQGIINCVLRNIESSRLNQKLDIADIGCGTGIMSVMWARQGHTVYGLDVNEALLEIAGQRAMEEGLAIEFSLGSATQLPWADQSMDVCIAPELLEHVVEWEACLKEFVRILKPNGILFISTANKLCPIQQEFNLPFYSWYPSYIKHYCEELARTTHPQLAGYAKYPAVNWFSFYQLRKEFSKLGMKAFDRFDIMDIDNKSDFKKTAIKIVRNSSLLRLFGHICTSGLPVLAIKNK
ncbi:MAG: class I SAM-dependent methyltransferase [Bacteroidetes bacterium]|nr:class I SAM-dependent methyltransferase [Bacteroidota bacterium]